MQKELVKKYLQGICTKAEFEEVLDWLKNDAKSIQSAELVKKIWEEYEPEMDNFSYKRYNRVLDRLHHRINLKQSEIQFNTQKRHKYSKTISVLLKIAAVLFIPIILTIFFTQTPWKYQFANNNSDLSVEVPVGSRMQIVLGDGTKVWLNGESQLIYPYHFKGKERRVQLSGEAYFEVAHNTKQPFIVESDQILVKAVGTSFNVNAYPARKIIETTLIEGKVILQSKDEQKIKELLPNQCIKYNLLNNRYTLEEGNMQKYIVWKDGRLMFKNDSIEQIAERLEHWYNVDIKIIDERIKVLTYTATFNNESLSQILELIALATPIDYKLLPREKLPDGSYSKQEILIGLKE